MQQYILSSILTFRAEIRQLIKNGQNKLLATEMDFWKWSAGRSRKNWNEGIGTHMGGTTTIIDKINKNQCQEK